MKRLTAAAAALGVALAPPAAFATKRSEDLPHLMAAARRPISTPRTCSNCAATDVEKGSGSKLKDPAASERVAVLKAPRKSSARFCRGGQAQARRESLLVSFENEDPLFGVDGVPFLAASYGDLM